jgi:hypothetical protein
MRKSKGDEKERWGWTEGKVDPAREHIRISCEGCSGPMALVANSVGEITVEFLVNCEEEAKTAIVKELDFYFVELREMNPWGYAIYHCSTGANAYSNVRWGYFPAGKIVKEGDDS